MHTSLPTVAAARDYLSRFNFFERYAHGAHEGEVYVDTHVRRFVETLKQLPPLPPSPRVLELGAVPYSMTLLLQTCLGADVTPLSFYEIEQPQSRHVLESADGERFEFEYTAVNVERDIFPLPDGRFDLVLCCEILEHLLINPSHMLFEAHRVLKPGGHLLVSTPNVTRAENVRALEDGRNINDAYHGNGIYGRHNREFAPGEVALILESCGYDVVRNTTVDVYDSTPPGAAAGREDTIFALACASRPRRLSTPAALYVLMEEYLNVIRGAITMGVDDVGHLGRGWYDLEWEGETGFRWMHQRASIHLLLRGATSVSVHAQVHHPDVTQNGLTVTLALDGRVVADRTVTDHRWQEIVFELSAPLSGPVELGLGVDRDWSPGGGDSRRLGIRVHHCEGR